MKQLRGFTLIELMVVVAVVAILATIALPSYQDSVRKSRRGQAKTDMLEITQALERHYSINRDYSTFAVPADWDQSPREGDAQYVVTGFDAMTPTAYELTATPQGGQANDLRCGTLRIDSRGRKFVSGTDSVADCW